MAEQRPSVFVGLAEVAGYFGNLVEGLHAIGCRVGFLNTNSFRFDYPEPAIDNPALFRATSAVARILATRQGPGQLLLRWGGYVPLKCLSFLYALARFQVFVFGGNSSFFSLRELAVYRWLGKKTVFVSLGSDSRPAYLSGIYKDDLSAGRDRSAWIVERDARTCQALARIDATASVVVDYPSHAHFRRRTCCSGLALGFPIAGRVVPESGSASAPIAGPVPVRILHAPTRPTAKGSDRVRQIVVSLRAKGFDIDYVEVVGKTNREVLVEIARSDLVVDECFSDLPLGGLGAEAALLGKPVVVGGYFAPLVGRYLRPEEIPPSIFVLPEDMEASIQAMVERPDLRREAGARLRAFVMTSWSSVAVARRYLLVLSGRAPREWFFEPRDLDYFLGWGLTRDEAREVVTAIVEKYTESALHLDHCTPLRARLLAASGASSPRGDGAQ